MFRTTRVPEFSNSMAMNRVSMRFQQTSPSLRPFSFGKFNSSLWSTKPTIDVPKINSVWAKEPLLPWNKHAPLFVHRFSTFGFPQKRGFSTATSEQRTTFIPFAQFLNPTEAPMDTESVEFKEKLKASQEDADRFPDNAKLQADYLKLLNMVNPSEVVKRIKGGQYAMNEATRKELMKALLKTGEFDAFPIDSVLKEKKEQQGATPKNPLYITQTGSNWASWVQIAISLAVAGAIIYFWFGKGGVGAEGMLGKQSMLNPVERSNTTFDDVKGADEAKEELQDIVEFLKNPAKFSRLSAKIPKGVMLVGPPGCGKTLVARALAGEAGVPFFFASGSEFEEMFVGVGASRVRKLFEKAKAMAPCVVFIDEIDAIGGRRDSPDNRYHKMTLNQLLVELDGFEQHTGIIVVAATNIPDTLDPAITRPGRFDRSVLIDLPDIKARREILELYLAGRGAVDVDYETLARATPGMSGAEIFNMVNIAAIEATKRNLTKIPMSMIRSAMDHVHMGPARKAMVIRPETKRLTAFHEAGHALVGYYSPGSNEIVKATLVPRGHALGMVSWLPKDEHLTSKEDYVSQIDTCMGGRVAEELIFGPTKITPGAGSDLQQATRVARAMVVQLGMGQKIGKLAFTPQEIQHGLMSPDTARVVEEEVREILEDSYSRAKNILTSHRKELDLLANALLEHETLTLEEIKMVIHGQDIKSHMKSKKQEELDLIAKENELYGGGVAEPALPELGGLSPKQPLAVEAKDTQKEEKQQVL